MASLNGGGHLINVCIREKNEKMNFCKDITPEDKKIILELFSEFDKMNVSVYSLMKNSYNTSKANVDVAQFNIKIAHKNENRTIQLITINNEVECYYIKFQGRHWFFKDEIKYHTAIKYIIYGKGKVGPDNAI